MILEAGDDIKVLEQQPAYLRRNKKIKNSSKIGRASWRERVASPG